MNHPLLKCWKKQKLIDPPYLFDGDREILKSKLCIEILSHKKLIQHKEYPPKDSRFHVGLIPVPFVGNLKTADIYIALINPGLTVCDYYVEETEPEYQQFLRRNLKQDLGSERYPFFKLDPKWDWTSAGVWWHRTLGSVIREVAKKRNENYQEATEFVAKRIAALEFAPYHSVNGGFVKSGSNSLESSKLMLSFVHKEIIPRADRGEALLIIARGMGKWQIKQSNNVIVYKTKHARSASLSMKSRGGKAIFKRLIQFD